MAVQFSCPECGKVLKSSNPLTPGKKVKCPACAAVFSPAPAKAAAPMKAAKKPPVEDDETVELPRTKPTAPPAKKPSKPAPLEDLDDLEDMEDDLPPVKTKPGAKKAPPPLEDEEDEEDFTPPPKGKTPPKKGAELFDDEDEDDAPPAKPKAGPPAKKGAPPKDDFGFGDEDEEMEDDLPPVSAKGKKGPPPKKGKMRDEEDDFDDDGDPDDEDDEDDRPSKKGKSGKPAKGQKKKSNALLFVIIGILLIAGLGAVAAFVYPGFLNEPATPKGSGLKPGPGPGPGPVMPMGPLEDPLAYMPADATVVIGSDVGGIRKGKIASRLFTMLSGKVQEGVKEAPPEVGQTLNELLNSVEKVYIGVIAPDPKAKPMTVTAFAFSADVDMEKIKKTQTAKEVPEKSYLRVGEGALLANPNPKILVIADMPEAEFEKRLTDLGNSVVVSEDLKAQVALVQDAHFFLVAANSPAIAPTVAKLQEGGKDLGPQIAPAAEAVAKFKAATLAIRDVDTQMDIKIRIVCQDEKDAAAVDAGVKGAIGLLPFFLKAATVKKAEKGGVPPELIETLQAVVGTFKSGVSGEEAWMSVHLSDENIKTLEAMALLYFLAAEEPIAPPMKKIDPMPSKFSFDKAPVPELQGKWKLSKVYDEFGGGKKSYLALSSPSFLTIKGNESTFETDNDGKKVAMTYTLEVDASKTPKVYRQTLAEKDGGGAVLGIYSVEKDILLMAYQADGMPPESMTVTKGDGKMRQLFEFERMAP